VRSLDDYWIWLDGLMVSWAVKFETTELIVSPIGDPDGVWDGLIVEPQTLRFYDGTFLHIRLVVRPDLTPDEYSFHYASEDGRFFWRKCKNRNHLKDLGQLEHIHRPGDPEQLAIYDEVDFEDVFNQIRNTPR
jgi:hypothetical protein